MNDPLPRRPRVTPAEAEELAAALWGVSAQALPLPGERDLNFAVGARVLKISESGASAAQLDLEERLIRAAAAQVRVAVPIPLPDGRARASRVFDGRRHWLRLFPRLPGRALSSFRRRPPALLARAGETAARLQSALASVAGDELPPADIPWRPDRYEGVIRAAGRGLRDPELYDRIRERTLPRLTELLGLPENWLHNDLNDDNLLLEGEPENPGALAVLDFGDASRGPPLLEAANAALYLSLTAAEPLEAALAVLRAFAPALAAEAELFPTALAARALVSAAVSAGRANAGEAYLVTSEDGMWRFLSELDRTPGALLAARARVAAGFRVRSADPGGAAVRPIEIPDDAPALDLGPEALAGPEELADAIPPGVSIGRYREPRLLYAAPGFRGGSPVAEPRTIHLGIDVFAPAGTEVRAPLDGAIDWIREDAVPLGFGPCLAIRHPGGFGALYGHLARECLARWKPGDPVRRGDRIARLGTEDENGGWPPHLHFQLLTADLGFGDDPPGVAAPRDLPVLEAMSPNPAAFLGLDPDRVAVSHEALAEPEHLLKARRRRISAALSLSGDPPVSVARGRRTRLYDNLGRDYLDMVNNVCHVGHAHPRVAEAIARQARLLNTNTRYLYRQLTEYAEALAETLPEPLSVVFFTNSGSEANDLALRLARARLGRDDAIVFDGGYHGNLTSLIQISPYKLDGPGGGRPHPRLHRLPAPDGFRGRFRRNRPDWTQRLMEDAARRVAAAGPATLVHEAILSCGGQIVPPPGYLDALYRAVREAGGVIVADEVQTGFGRVGPAFWAFSDRTGDDAAVPDIVTVGKPAGNGHPLGAVVTTPEVARSFEDGMEYFNTFGGNPVSCAAGLAVLDVIRDEGLAERAAAVGARLLSGIAEIGRSCPILADVRGRGLFLGFELAHPGDPPAPATREAGRLVRRLHDCRILNSTDGPDRNVIKLKPPLTFSNADADRYLETLDFALREQFT